ncbi:MAG TPA: hypothetical protein VJK48_05835 [Chlamydiales bacterium]|nr:hypothetical protein [Chlamydiales bacterium]
MNSVDITLENINKFILGPEGFDAEHGAQIAPSAYGQTKGQSFTFLTEQVAILDSSDCHLLIDRRDEIRDLFFRNLKLLEYDRGAIRSGGALEKILDPKLFSARTLPDVEDSVSGKLIQATLAEAAFALQLGVKPEKRENPWHLVYYFFDRSGSKPLGVFKPREKGIFISDKYGSSEIREAHLAEVANSKIDQLFGLHLVPYTTLLTCKPEEQFYTGSFQFFVENAPPLFDYLEGDDLFDANHSALKTRIDTVRNRELEFPNLEFFAFFDLLTGNNDHHFSNILVKELSYKKWQLVAIDNGNSFPWCHDQDIPRYKIHPNHWYKWSLLPQANRPFSEEMIDWIQQFDSAKMEEILRAELIHKDVRSSKTYLEGKIRTTYDRLQWIQELSSQRVSMSEIASAILKLSSQHVP